MDNTKTIIDIGIIHPLLINIDIDIIILIDQETEESIDIIAAADLIRTSNNNSEHSLAHAVEKTIAQNTNHHFWHQMLKNRKHCTHSMNVQTITNYH